MSYYKNLCGPYFVGNHKVIISQLSLNHLQFMLFLDLLPTYYP